MRVLIVDDSQRARESLAALVWALHDACVVDVAGTIAEGFSSHMVRVPDLTLVSSRLPDGDGFELVRVLRGAGASGVIVVTVNDGTDADRHAAQDAGADALVDKAADAETTLRDLRVLLSR